MLWNDANVIIPDKLKAIYDRAGTLSAKSDVIRFSVIQQYGGFYIDTDTEPLRRMDFLDSVDFFAGYQTKDEINGALYGANKENELVNIFVDNLESYVHQRIKELGEDWNEYSAEFTGPYFITKMAQPYLNRNGYLFLDTKCFYPYWPWDSVKNTYPETYSVHKFAHSWKDY
jgi:mannosyltransferase OCH1-like enzyme